jgi:hypothetical protein
MYRRGKETVTTIALGMLIGDAFAHGNDGGIPLAPSRTAAKRLATARREDDDDYLDKKEDP